MTFSKEQISQAFTEVLNERVPDLSNIPDHTFSERFEKNMNRLIKKEAAHPWAVSHTLARNLIAAALVIVLLFAMCMSVGAVRNRIFNFFLQHFDIYNNVVFESVETAEFTKKYTITAIPNDFLLVTENNGPTGVNEIYGNANGDYITFKQSSLMEQGLAIDNERSQYDYLEIDGKGIFNRCATDEVVLAWEQDEYTFLLVVSKKGVLLDDAIKLYRSVEPVS